MANGLLKLMLCCDVVAAVISSVAARISVQATTARRVQLRPGMLAARSLSWAVLTESLDGDWRAVGVSRALAIAVWRKILAFAALKDIIEGRPELLALPVRE